MESRAEISPTSPMWSRPISWLANLAEGAVGNVYNVACGTRFNLKEVVGTLNRILGTNLKPVHDAPRPGDIRHSHADISRAANDLGYSPQTDFEDGLNKTVEWYRRNV